MPVLDVGSGVGYLRKRFEPTGPSMACLLLGRGSPGEEESGSKGGRSEGAGRLVPAMLDGEEPDATGGSVGSTSSMFLLCGDEFMVVID